MSIECNEVKNGNEYMKRVTITHSKYFITLEKDVL